MHDESVNVTKDNIRFVMIYDRENNRFLVEEASYEVKKYFVLEYDEDRAENGIGNHLQVTQYTTITPNLGTSSMGRGQRGIEIDTKELMALRNVVHFNCINPFQCC